MQELDDIALLREYVNRDSEEAFATLVTRHVNKVYSVALRHTRNPHQAEEITQAVFVILAKKSHNLSRRVVLSGWLYQTSRLTAVTFIRSEIRRARREQEAHMQTLVNKTESDVWPQIAPLLDTAMAGLSETDRHAVVLRFFDGKSMKEVGAALGASEDAAKMRLNRAVEKLRGFFTKRGVVLPAVVLTAAISANSVQAAPAMLAKAATAVAFAKGATASGSTLTLIKGALNVMAWTKAKTAIVSAVIVTSVMTSVLVQHRAQTELAPVKAFSISAGATASASDPNLIEIGVNISNLSNKSVEIVTIEGQQVFSVRISDDRGVLIDRDKNPLVKDRTQKESKLRFMPGEMKNYKTTLSTVKDAQGKDDLLPPGTYSVQVVFPVVSYVEGKYVVELIKSEPVKVEVKLKETIAWGAPTNSFGIYLTAEPVDARITAYGKGDWSHIRLAESPVISDADILTYDFTNHLMTLKPVALKRLPQPNASGRPFVVVANGERVYLGVFMTLDSSVSRAIPSIVIDEQIFDTNLPPNALRISRVYGAPYSKTDPDPRSDDRIKRALTALDKLK